MHAEFGWENIQEKKGLRRPRRTWRIIYDRIKGTEWKSVEWFDLPEGKRLICCLHGDELLCFMEWMKISIRELHTKQLTSDEFRKSLCKVRHTFTVGVN